MTDALWWLVFLVGVVHSVCWLTRFLEYAVGRACYYQPWRMVTRDRVGDVVAGLCGVCAAVMLYALLLLVEAGQ